MTNYTRLYTSTSQSRFGYKLGPLDDNGLWVIDFYSIDDDNDLDAEQIKEVSEDDFMKVIDK